jgi:L-2,4-diaminobutyrate decarboxylase
MAVFEMGPAAAPIEHAIVHWLAEQIGFGDGAGGVLTSGGSVGNLTALLAARQVARAGDADRPVVLVSSESHYSIARAVRIMGLDAVSVAVDDRLRLDPRALDDAAEAATGRPFAIVAAAGSTGCGAFDPLPEVAAIAKARGLWLHVDAAHGAGVVLSRRHRALAAGIELADSVVWDAHKLLMMPALVTAVLFRDNRAGAAAFAQDAAYLFSGASAADEWWDVGLRTIECTKRMMALELHATLRAHGVSLFRDVVDRLIALGGALAARVTVAPDFELLVEPEANIVCFRHVPDGVADRDAHNAALRARVVRDGRFYIVQTRSRGAIWLRCALMNPLAEARDLDDLLDHLRAISAAADVAGV